MHLLPASAQANPADATSPSGQPPAPIPYGAQTWPSLPSKVDRALARQTKVLPGPHTSPNLGTLGTLQVWGGGVGRKGEKRLHSQGTEGHLLSISGTEGM